MALDTAYDVAVVEALRAREYARLDAHGHVYPDYTGAGLYAESQVREHLALLGRDVFGNPHSTNPTSRLATDYAERARASVLEFFGASPDEYTVVFTANASGALKLVGEAYPFRPGSRLVLTADNHNSVNGIREYARAAGTPVTCVPLEVPAARGCPGVGRRARAAAHPVTRPVRLPGPVQSVGRPAPAGVDRMGQGPRLGRAARRGRLRAHQSPARCGPRSASPRPRATSPASWPSCRVFSSGRRAPCFPRWRAPP
jgi:Aminotransferase class-V